MVSLLSLDGIYIFLFSPCICAFDGLISNIPAAKLVDASGNCSSVQFMATLYFYTLMDSCFFFSFFFLIQPVFGIYGPELFRINVFGVYIYACYITCNGCFSAKIKAWCARKFSNKQLIAPELHFRKRENEKLKSYRPKQQKRAYRYVTCPTLTRKFKTRSNLKQSKPIFSVQSKERKKMIVRLFGHVPHLRRHLY